MVEKEFEKEASAGLKKRSLNEMFGENGLLVSSLSYKGRRAQFEIHKFLFLWSQA